MVAKKLPGETLKEREKVLVLVLEHIPLLNEWRHKEVDVLRLVQVVTNTVRQSSNSIIPEHSCYTTKTRGWLQLTRSAGFYADIC